MKLTAINIDYLSYEEKLEYISKELKIKHEDIIMFEDEYVMTYDKYGTDNTNDFIEFIRKYL